MRCISWVSFAFLIVSAAPAAAQSPQYRHGGPPPFQEECPQGRQIRSQKACQVLDADTAMQNSRLRQRAAAPPQTMTQTVAPPRPLSQEQIRRLIEQQDAERAARVQQETLVSDPPSMQGGSSQAPIVTNDLHNLSGKTDFSKGLVFIVAGLLVYFLPSLMAAGAGHHNKGAIFALNLFLGWSFLGWVAAFVWACTKPAPRVPIDHGDVLVARREPLM
jgi:Superinfection immunity protein